MDGSNDSAAWKALEKHSKDFKGTGFRLRDLFDADSDRFREYSLSHEGLLLDYSKNFLNSETIRLLLELAEQRQLTKAIDSMFSGEKVNTTEHRAALHVALRDPSDASSHPEISETLDRIERLVVDVHGGTWLGYAGDTISDVVNLGIGGSDLGPAMVCDALSPCANTKLNVHFVSNIDPSHLQNTLKNLRPRDHTLRHCLQVFFDARDPEERRGGESMATPVRGCTGYKQTFCCDNHEPKSGYRVRDRGTKSLPAVGLGRRPLFIVVGDRAAHRAGIGHGRLQTTSCRR